MRTTDSEEAGFTRGAKSQEEGKGGEEEEEELAVSAREEEAEEATEALTRKGDTDGELARLHGEVSALKRRLREADALAEKRRRIVSAEALPLFATAHALQGETDTRAGIPAVGTSARHAREVIAQAHLLDFKPRLNTSSYVNVCFEPEEREVAALGLEVNMADQSVYPASTRLHDDVVHVLARLWNCPAPPADDAAAAGTVYAGAGTVGSTEACLLAGLALKMRWRAWHREHRGPTLPGAPVPVVVPVTRAVNDERPNLVISSLFQACWEKFFRYFDVEPRIVHPAPGAFSPDPQRVAAACDDNTIGVVCILGNHYTGHYDDVRGVGAAVAEMNRRCRRQVGIHVDAASGGFVAPFQRHAGAWDFRVPEVLSISASGHKFGQSCCGTGWIVWRRRRGLAQHVAVSVSYLGGVSDSYTLNFSRPAAGVYCQMYKFLRLGVDGYESLTSNAAANAMYLRRALAAMTGPGDDDGDGDPRPRFVMLDALEDNDEGSCACLPVVAARLNPALGLSYDDHDLQHELGQSHWFVGAYPATFHHPTEVDPRTGAALVLPLVECDTDTGGGGTMFRVVVKANTTRALVENLAAAIGDAVARLDALGPEGFTYLHCHSGAGRHAHHRTC